MEARRATPPHHPQSPSASGPKGGRGIIRALSRGSARPLPPPPSVQAHVTPRIRAAAVKIILHRPIVDARKQV